MSRPLLYSLIAGFSFIGFILAYLPAAPIWRLIAEDVQARIPDLQVMDVGGTVWQGQASFQQGPFPASQLHWQLSPAQLLLARLGLTLHMSGQDHDLRAEVVITPGDWQLTRANGSLGSQYLNPAASRYGLRLTGTVRVDELALRGQQKRLSHASGQLQWTGGSIETGNPNYPQAILLPALAAPVSLQGDALRLVVASRDEINAETAPLLQLLVKADGWAEVAIKARLFMLARIPWPGDGGPDTTVLVLEQAWY